MTARAATDPRNHQRGGFLLGLIIGLLFGLAIALGVALSVNNVQVPFSKKLPQRTAEQDAAEAQRNQNWNPNAALAVRRPDLPKPSEGPTSAPTNPLAAPPYVILPPPDPMASPSAQAPIANYFVQAGAFRRQDEAEHQRARLNMLDLEARVTTVDQSGQAIYRVRVGPMDKNAAETTRTQLELEGIDASLIFVKPSSSAKN